MCAVFMFPFQSFTNNVKFKYSNKRFREKRRIVAFLLFLDSLELKNFKVFLRRQSTIILRVPLGFLRNFRNFCKIAFFVWTESANIFNWKLSIHFNQMTINWRLFCLLQFLCFVNQLFNSIRLVVEIRGWKSWMLFKVALFNFKLKYN